MDFLISNAWAAGAAPATPEATFMSFLPLIGLVVLFYFMLIRPQMKRSKEHRQLLEKLGKGDEVLTNGGIAGKIRELGETFLLVELADGVEVKVQKGSVTSVLPKGSLDHL